MEEGEVTQSEDAIDRILERLDNLRNELVEVKRDIEAECNREDPKCPWCGK